MNIKCVKCRAINIVDWKVDAFGLKEIIISFNCVKCEHPHKLRIYIGEGKVEKTKLEDDRLDYVG